MANNDSPAAGAAGSAALAAPAAPETTAPIAAPMAPEPTPPTPARAAKAPPPASASESRRESIPVKRIVFAKPTDMPGGKGGGDSLQTTPRAQVIGADGKRINRAPAWLIDYLPWLRHHRVTYYPPGGKAEEVRMVPEAALKSWDPVQ